jgi:predicted nucleic acid-binding protein
VPDAAVVNASPLIFLSRVRGLRWLSDLFPDTILIPQSVAREVAAGDDGAPILEACKSLAAARFIDDLVIPPVVAAWDLGAGETQVLAHCRSRPGSIAVVDDGAARECARSLDLPVVGTLGIVLAAKRMGWIPAARPVVDELTRAGLYLTPVLVSEALREVGE